MPGFDEVSMGVELGVRGGATFLCRWTMTGVDERLVFGEAEEELQPGGLKRIDVSRTPHWSPLVGRSISRVGIACHIPDEETGEAPWTVRLVLESSASVVLALGEAEVPGLLELTKTVDTRPTALGFPSDEGHFPTSEEGEALCQSRN
jgi:hypothetical protein